MTPKSLQRQLPSGGFSRRIRIDIVEQANVGVADGAGAIRGRFSDRRRVAALAADQRWLWPPP